MSNPLSYRCPRCESTDQIEICAFVSVRLTEHGAEITEGKYIDGSHWSSENAAGCGACSFEGVVKDFEPRSATVIDFRTHRV